MSVVEDAVRPSNFLYADILEFLIRNRKVKLDFSVEGYAAVQTVVQRMGQLGYDEGDSFKAISKLVNWNLVEPESLLIDHINLSDPIQVHASGFMHMRYFLKRSEYIIGISPDLSVSSYELASEIADAWRVMGSEDIHLKAKKRLIIRMEGYFISELERRSKRHAFYGELGFGGKSIVQAISAMANQVRDQDQRRK